jgi:hypothetical protein
MLGARNFESKEDELDDMDDLFGSKKVTKEGRRTKRYLKKLEGKGDYESDESDENPYATEAQSPRKLKANQYRKKRIRKLNRYQRRMRKPSLKPPAQQARNHRPPPPMLSNLANLLQHPVYPPAHPA